MANKPGRIDDDPVPEQSTVDEPKQGEDASKNEIKQEEQKNPDADEAKDDHVFIRPGDLHLKSDEVHEPKPNDLAKLFAGAITGLHHELAVSTKYSGWELDEQNQALWTQFWTYLLPHIPIENLGLYIALVFIIIFETSKAAGYMHYVAERKKLGAAPA